MAIRASISLRNIEAQVTYESLEAAVAAAYANATNIIVIYNAQNRFVEESPSVFDIDVVHFNKNTTDAAALSDDDVLAIGKNLSESPSVSNIFLRIVQFSRGFSEPTTLTDDDSKSFGKNLTEAPSVAETSAFDILKPLAEDLTAVGDFTRNVVYKRVPTENLGTTDVYSRQVAYSRQFADSVYPTDDLDGEASLQDDQEMFFVKTRTDLTNITESLTRVASFNRAFTDSSVITDAYAAAIGKAASDTFGTSDDQSLDVGKNLNDTSAATETHRFSTSKILVDTSSATDAPAKGLSKPASDSAGMTDDDVVSFGKAQTDPVSTADAGSLVSQGYVDNNQYFAEIYVGTSRSF